ncbi:MAG: crossover junction endodeoxyribonuclease RuvC [Pirellula sp.]|jgi:crossover junction endodeoxyribonuclease RuvC|nr:crossover junction endodeoxyribonuclease RuvC [Pirellula sp.]
MKQTQPKEQWILGVDPGLQLTGYGIIKSFGGKVTLIEAGVIRVSRSQSLPARLSELYEGISEVIKTYSLNAMAIEQLYSHYERPRTAILMGHARGVLFLAGAHNSLEVYSYAATQVKKLLTGNGRAPKDQMQRAIQMQLSLKEPPDPPDVADALAIALCHHFSSGSMAKLLLPKSEKFK